MCALHIPDNTLHVLLIARALFQHDHGRQCCGPPRPQAEYNIMHGLSVLPAVYHTSIVILSTTEDQRQASSSWWMKVLQVRQSQSSHICSIRLHIQTHFLLMGFWNLQGCKVHQTWTDVNNFLRPVFQFKARNISHSCIRIEKQGKKRLVWHLNIHQSYSISKASWAHT